MKKAIALLMSCLCLLTFCACGVSQEEYDAQSKELNEALKELEEAYSDLEKVNKQLTDTKSQLETAKTQLKDSDSQLEQTKTQLEQTKTELENTQARYEELKNGPKAQLAAIRTAYDKQDWAQVVSLAKKLNSQYGGYDEDIEAQQLAAKAQKTIDDEKAKAEAEAKKSKEEKVHSIIRITRLDCSRPNSADGVGIYLNFVNMHPEKTIKYLEVTVIPKNAVGDTMDCDIRGYSRYTCEATGPYAPGKGLSASDNWWWGNAWYNSTIKSVELVGVSIDYMDGTWVTLKSDELEFAIW